MAGDVPETVNARAMEEWSARMIRGKKYSVLHGETDVDQEVATATGDEGRRCRRKEDGDLASVHDSIKQLLSNKSIPIV